MLPAFLADLPLEDFEVLRHEVRRRLRAHDRAMAQKKRCPGCGESKALTEWGVNAGRRDGLQSHCRICMRAVRDGVTPSQTSSSTTALSAEPLGSAEAAVA